MTREEAITVLKGLYDNPLFGDVHKAAFNIAIHDIKAYHKWNLNELVLTQDVQELEEDKEPTTKHDLGVDSTSNTISFDEMMDNLKITAEDIDNAEDLEYSIEPLNHPKNNLGVDCVSKQAVFYTIYDNKSDFKNDFAQGFFADKIRELPSVTPQERKGHWIPTYGNVECSVCGSVKDSREVGKATHYCDFCGAKMVEPQDEDKE